MQINLYNNKKMLFELSGTFQINTFQSIHLPLSHLEDLIPAQSKDILLPHSVSTAGTCQILLAGPVGAH